MKLYYHHITQNHNHKQMNKKQKLYTYKNIFLLKYTGSTQAQLFKKNKTVHRLLFRMGVGLSATMSC